MQITIIVRQVVRASGAPTAEEGQLVEGHLATGYSAPQALSAGMAAAADFTPLLTGG